MVYRNTDPVGEEELYFTAVNEALVKEEQISINYTMDNWVALNDPHLYLYLTGENHTLNVNGTLYNAVWDDDAKTFTVTAGGTHTHSYGAWTLDESTGIYSRSCSCGEVQSCLLGDANGDSMLNASDAGTLLLVASNAYTPGETQQQMIANIKGDGYAAKASTVLRYLVGLTDSLLN